MALSTTHWCFKVKIIFQWRFKAECWTDETNGLKHLKSGKFSDPMGVGFVQVGDEVSFFSSPKKATFILGTLNNGIKTNLMMIFF